MATDSKELKRVRFIHRHLDLLATSHPDDGVTCFFKVDSGDGFATHEYTAAEVRAWPETKAKLRAPFAQYDWCQYAYCHGDGSVRQGSGDSPIVAGKEAENVRRDLSCTRSSSPTPSAPAAP